MNKFYKRINYQGRIEDISLKICKDFQIGNFVSNKLVLMGYEDFNYILETTKNKYFIKIFANFRTDNDCQRYVNIMLKVINKGINFPKLFEYREKYLYKIKLNDTKLRLCVMEYIDGKTYYSQGNKPNIKEIKFLAYQAALINSIRIKPRFIYDQWAIVNLLNEFKKKGRYLSNEDSKIIKPLIKEFKDLKIQNLPHCFVHGDIIATNVMKDTINKLWIIDFAVANYYPRIQELAILACNLLFNEKNKNKSEINLKIALEEYQKIIKLTSRELKALPIYIKLAHVMHVLSANYEKVVEKNVSRENEYWLNQGRMGLKQIQEL